MKTATDVPFSRRILPPISFLVVSVFFLLPWVRGKVVTVGGSQGWTDFDETTSNAPDYQAWASSESIFPGDSVVFRYTPTFHTVYSLPTKLAFDNCNFAVATLLDDGASGHFTWVAPIQAGQYRFACAKTIEGQGSHCNAGQKITITVLSSRSSSPVASPPAPEAFPPSPRPMSHSPPHNISGAQPPGSPAQGRSHSGTSDSSPASSVTNSSNTPVPGIPASLPGLPPSPATNLPSQPTASPELAPEPVARSPALITTTSAAPPRPEASQAKSTGSQITQHWLSTMFWAWVIFF
ncbi:hypothetical protein O6H91_06G132100 [Diphasiastrum complanatum]|uniref:Uncharacterized protein n=1 Tax=Diphasiastrum complanatum TaxID=34168 RepID=A0ACC2DJH1_DIPCM|nr:hypothetical protein O6H91_06G132100 [Diphasiastrum complanatum]